MAVFTFSAVAFSSKLTDVLTVVMTALILTVAPDVSPGLEVIDAFMVKLDFNSIELSAADADLQAAAPSTTEHYDIASNASSSSSKRNASLVDDSAPDQSVFS